MEEAKVKHTDKTDAEAEVLVWKYVFGFAEMAVVKCAVELGIAETIEAKGAPMTLSELSDVLRCNSDTLHRIMRFLVHQKFFKEIYASDRTKSYALTPLARLFMKHGRGNMVDLLLLQSSPVMLAPWQHLSARVRENGPPPFVSAHGEDLWEYTQNHPEHNVLFNDAMACNAGLAVPAIVNACGQVFDGVKTVVDVGGGDGTTLRALVKAFPWIKGINFDLPHVVSVAPEGDGVEHVSGDMFMAVPKADAVFLKWVLHIWNDNECVQILKKCRDAVLDEDKGKVIIVEAVINEHGEDKFKYPALLLDMVMMAQTTTGKERTQEEWDSVISKAGFSSFTVQPIHTVHSVIIAYP